MEVDVWFCNKNKYNGLSLLNKSQLVPLRQHDWMAVTATNITVKNMTKYGNFNIFPL